jgi:hypothetical protein
MDWGKGTDWDWRNVINLCSGSSDAQKSADCFKKAIATGADWRDAILI